MSALRHAPATYVRWRVGVRSWVQLRNGPRLALATGRGGIATAQITEVSDCLRISEMSYCHDGAKDLGELCIDVRVGCRLDLRRLQPVSGRNHRRAVGRVRRRNDGMRGLLRALEREPGQLRLMRSLSHPPALSTRCRRSRSVLTSGTARPTLRTWWTGLANVVGPTGQSHQNQVHFN